MIASNCSSSCAIEGELVICSDSEGVSWLMRVLRDGNSVNGHAGDSDGMGSGD